MTNPNITNTAAVAALRVLTAARADTPPASAAAAPLVVTLLTPDERLRVTAIADGAFIPVHRSDPLAAYNDLRHGDVSGVLISLAAFDDAHRDTIFAMVDRYPTLPILGLVREQARDLYQAAAALGASGVRRIVDASGPDDARAWRQVRATFAADPDQQYARSALAAVLADLDRAGVADHHGMRRLLAHVFGDTPLVRASGLARALGVNDSTFVSRFFRHRLPSPKRYIVLARLVRIARLGENRILSLAAVAHALGFASPQGMGRFVRTATGLTAQQFRDGATAAARLEAYRAELVRPFVTSWAAGVDPLDFAPRGRRAPRRS